MRPFVLLTAIVFLPACSEHSTPVPVEAVPSAFVLSEAAALASLGYVPTPDGWYHRSCVHELPERAWLGPGEVVNLVDGTSSPIPKCRFPAYGGGSRGVGQRPPQAVPSYTGWIEWASATLSAGNWFTKLTASWHVPGGALSYSSSQTYFAFPGLRNGYVIIQPVIQYGWNSKYGGGNYWSAASWLCNGDGTYCFYGPNPINGLGRGDSIVGSVVSSNCNLSGLCDWTITVTDVDSAKSNSLFLRGDTAYYPEPYVNAVPGVVEVFGLSQCSHFPSNGVFFTGVKVYDRYGYQYAPTWVDSINGAASPPCGFGVRWRETSSGVFSVDLTHNPGAEPSGDSTWTNPVSVGISGPEVVPGSEMCTWIAGASGGTEPYYFSWTLDGEAVGDSTGTLITTTPESPSPFLITVVGVDANGYANGANFWVDIGSVNSCDPERRVRRRM